MKWFRLYSSVLNDPKVQQLSPELFKHWINILCVASEHEPRGTLPPVKELAFALRLKPIRCAKIVERLCAAGVLEACTDGTPEVHGAYTARTVRVHNWESRQRESDNVAARVEKHRHRKEADSDSGAIRNVTLHETLLQRTVDTDTDTEKETETLLVSVEGISKRESATIREPLARTRSPSHQNNNHEKKPIPIKPKEAKPTNNPLWDVLCEVFYTPTTKAECSNFGKIVRELKAVDATPEDVRYRVRQHALRQNHWDMTPNALLPHWTELGTKNGKAASNNGTTQQGTLDPTQDPERLKRYARLVQRRGQRQVTG